MAPPSHGDSLWRTTRQSVIDPARDLPPGIGRDAAWQRLVDIYRRPIRVCILRRVSRHPDRDAIIEEFFTYLFTEDVVGKLDQSKGSFRAFLQAVMRNYVHAKIRACAQAGDDSRLEQLFEVGPPSGFEVEEERIWAQSLLDRAVRRLLNERSRDYQILLQVYGIQPYTLTDTASVAASHGLSVDAVHKVVSRTRDELRRLLEAEIVHLADGREDYESEKAALIGRLLEARPDLLG